MPRMRRQDCEFAAQMREAQARACADACLDGEAKKLGQRSVCVGFEPLHPLFGGGGDVAL
jgi:hypothetical protein